MDYVSLLCAFLAGCLVYRLVFDRGGPGPFEKTIWAGLYEGKRVIVSIEKEAYIFEMYDGNRLRITSGTTIDYLEDSDGVLADDVDHVSGIESTDSSADSLQNDKKQ